MKKILLLFTFGGILYGAMEVIYREYTHFSMFLAGGLSFVLIGLLGRSKRDIPVTVRMLIGAGIITSLELIFGLIFNVWLRQDVWDYRHEPFNLFGQICLHATAIWVFLSFIAVYFDVFMRWGMFGERIPRMRVLP
jgi:uncharacterized membrane protein